MQFEQTSVYICLEWHLNQVVIIIIIFKEDLQVDHLVTRVLFELFFFFSSTSNHLSPKIEGGDEALKMFIYVMLFQSPFLLSFNRKSIYSLM